MKYAINMLARPKEMRVSQMSGGSDINSGMEIYLKNSYVCLRSVKLQCSEIECVLITDFDLLEEWKRRFSRVGICIQYVPFGRYAISENFDWGIVQYRYDVLDHLCTTLADDDCVIMLDTDVLCAGDPTEAYEEAEQALCLFDVQHSLHHRDRANIINNYSRIYPGRPACTPIHRGGEYIGGKICDIKKLFAKSKTVMEDASRAEGLVNFNDEHITSIAADRLMSEICIKNANAYIYRYWTRDFYLVSTNYMSNPVVFWHLPAEKEDGMIRVYKYLIKNDRMPSNEQMAEWFLFPSFPKSKDILRKVRRELTR